MSPEEQLDAIVGEAIKALVDSGASAPFLGSFAATYKPRFAQHLGVTLQAPPDLKAVISEAVTQAVQQVLSDQPASATSASEEARVRIQVICGGHRTSVSVRQSRIEQIGQIVGTRKESHRIVRELAAGAPSDTSNRSQWLDSQIDAYLQLQHQPAAGAQPH